MLVCFKGIKLIVFVCLIKLEVVVVVLFLKSCELVVVDYFVFFWFNIFNGNGKLVNSVFCCLFF